MSTRQWMLYIVILIMILYVVAIKHLQNIHKVMQSVDNTFISIIYLQFKCFFLCSNLLFVTLYNNSTLTSFTYPIICKLPRAKNKGYVQNVQQNIETHNPLKWSKMTDNFSLITAYKVNAAYSHFRKMFHTSQSPIIFMEISHRVTFCENSLFRLNRVHTNCPTNLSGISIAM